MVAVAETLHKLICDQSAKIVCLGTELRSDDKVGLLFCDFLASLGFERSRLIKCEFGLENCLNELIENKVSKALIVDAAIFTSEELHYAFVGLEDIKDFKLATTHSIPLSHVINILRSEGLLNEILILGIAAKNLDVGEEITPEVLKTSEELAHLIIKLTEECG
ncbi:MAG: hypothetical protein B7O98_00275 [Zestosphaera tikiterensis]|uniref:Hydrogenase maturation protease n=1 Tax=Zestosphaera tikiterensis TaxID=1973259 RepID=A0A2R7Y8N2_9CREN|nr:MAG: hypothetical protein B7O98_00275 [Zestosphaera tikiterensis]